MVKATAFLGEFHRYVESSIDESGVYPFPGISQFQDEGTEFDDVLTCLYWDGASIHSGVINYQHEPRIVRPIDWENLFWNFTMAKEIRLFSVGQVPS